MAPALKGRSPSEARRRALPPSSLRGGGALFHLPEKRTILCGGELIHRPSRITRTASVMVRPGPVVPLLLLAIAPFVVGCASEREAPSEDVSLSRDAKLDTFKMLREDLDTARHPSDGGGKAWLVDPPASVPAASRRRFEIVYEAGPLGIEEGGAVYLQTSSFWDWDSPQVDHPEAPGYTEVRTDAPGVELAPRGVGPQLLAIDIFGRRLEPAERIRIVFGAGPAMARVDRYAEHRSPIWIAVDGDGDLVRALVADSPTVDVTAGRPARLVLSLPSTARPGDVVRLTICLLDSLGNAGFPFTGEVVLQTRPKGLDLPEKITFAAEDRGQRAIEVAVRQEGVYRLQASAVDQDHDERHVLLTESNPLVVLEGAPRILWGDLHGHSQLSDGSGTPEDYYSYARDAAGLDAVALTDHDHWGMRFLDQNPELWDEVRQAARRFHEPGRFVAIVGYEWTSWLHGHRHVLYFEDEGEILSSMDPRFETPAQLWDALKDRSAITVAHHSAGGPVSTNWRFLPHPDIEPVTEIVSVHGSSEAPDSAGSIYDPVEGNFVRDALQRPIQFGFIGSGDSHDGHPGLAHLASPSGGLVAIFSEEVTREAILGALRERRVYATNGPRIWLRVWLDDHTMGAVLPSVEPEPTQRLRYAVAGTAPIERIDIIRSGEIVGSLPGEKRREASGALDVPSLEPAGYIYVRVLQEDGGTAWSSPIYQAAGTCSNAGTESKKWKISTRASWQF